MSEIEQSQENIQYDPIIEKLEELESQDWKEEIEDQVFFNGNVTNANVLMKAMIRGARHAYEINKEAGKIPENFQLPSIGSVTLLESATAVIDKNQIALPSYFNQDSLHDPSDTYIGKFNNEISEIGSLEDNYVLTGAEEMDHIIKAQSGILENSRIEYKQSKEAVSLADYDSSDIEAEGLNTKLKAALREGMSDQIISVLRTRTEKAVTERQKKQL